MCVPALYVRAPAHHMRVPALRIRVNILSSFIKVWLYIVLSSPCIHVSACLHDFRASKIW
jgi:hypothetical protein